MVTIMQYMLFLCSYYSCRVDENIPGGVVAVNVSVLNGTLQKEVIIILSTEDSTAICKPTM